MLMVFRLLVKEGLVDLCMQSLFRMKLDRKETFDPNQVLPYLVVTAMGTLCKLVIKEMCTHVVHSLWTYLHFCPCGCELRT